MLLTEIGEIGGCNNCSWWCNFADCGSVYWFWVLDPLTELDGEQILTGDCTGAAAGVSGGGGGGVEDIEAMDSTESGSLNPWFVESSGVSKKFRLNSEWVSKHTSVMSPLIEPLSTAESTKLELMFDSIWKTSIFFDH